MLHDTEGKGKMSEDCSAFNIRDDLKPLTLDKVKEIQRAASLPFSVAALNLCGNLNLGMMIRSAVLFGAEKFYIVGKKRYDKRSTVGAHNYIDLQFVECDPETDPYVCLDILQKDYNVFLIEQGGTDINHMDFGSYDKSCFIFGTESNGIPQAILDLNLSRCSIHQVGVLRSLNVSAAASIVMHKVATDLERKLK